MKREDDSLMNPPLGKLLEKIPQKYELVLVATRRAKQLIRQQRMLQLGAEAEISEDSKPLSIALNDIVEGRISADDVLAPEFDVDEPEDDASVFVEMTDFGDDFIQAEGGSGEGGEPSGEGESDELDSVDPEDPQFNWSGD
jgi:DNA-directed RNA polymerase omega subunit